MTLLPRIERLRLCQNFLQKFVADDQLARRFKRTDRATKPQQCFLIDRIVREILDDYAPALGQAFRCACNRFIERMNVMEGTRASNWPPLKSGHVAKRASTPRLWAAAIESQSESI